MSVAFFAMKGHNILTFPRLLLLTLTVSYKGIMHYGLFLVVMQADVSKLLMQEYPSLAHTLFNCFCLPLKYIRYNSDYFLVWSSN